MNNELGIRNKSAGFSEILLLLFIAFVAVAGSLWFFGRRETLEETTERVVSKVRGDAFNFDSNTPGYDTYKRLVQGCPAKDCIPSIDNPKFQSVSNAAAWLVEDDVVFALHYKGEAKAYPQKILNWHEIVNDEIGGDSVAITFCPLCGSALAFDRRVDGQVLEFGVSGKLHNNDLVMYDRQTNTLWQQITGEAIVGELFEKKLKQIPMDGMRWKEIKLTYPNAKVLSRNTGFDRDYNSYPYGSYEQDTSTLFPVEGGVDETIHPKTIVWGIEVNSKFKAYSESKLREKGYIRDSVGGVPIDLYFYNGGILVRNLRTKEEIVATRIFWFAWRAFRPASDLY